MRTAGRRPFRPGFYNRGLRGWIACILGAIGAAAACLAAPPRAPQTQTEPVTRYAVTDLGVLPGYEGVSGEAVNNRGQVVGYVYGRASGAGKEQARPFLWENGAMRPLETLSIYPVTTALDINDAGQIVGEAYFGESGQTFYSMNKRGVLWEKGRARELPCLPGYTFLNVMHINNRGQIAGVAAEKNAAQTYHAFLHDGNTMRLLLPGMAYGVSMRGEALCKGRSGGLLWSDGETKPLFLDDLVCITETGDVLGRVGNRYYLVPRGKPARPFAMQEKNLLLVAMNAKRQAAGSQDLPKAERRSEYYSTRAVLVANGRVIDLNTRIPARSGLYLERARDINDRGQILCAALQGKEGTFAARSVLLTPVAPSASRPKKGR